MPNLYKIKELIKPSFFQRFLKNEPHENAIIEVNNLLALKPIKEISLDEIVTISEKYKIDLRSRFIDSLNELYLIYLNQCFLDNSLSELELDDLNHLKNILLLKDYEVDILHNKLSSEVYKISYNEVISDGKIDESEELFLEKLKNNLKLPANIAEKISEESRKKFIKKKFNDLTLDKQISPDDWARFMGIAKNLDVNVKFDEITNKQIERFQLYWYIENAELPIREVSINLQKNEYCYFTSYVDWLENRTITKRINYAGPYARIKIMKGIYYRVGSIGYDKVTSDQVQLIDSGKVYITNKRIIFVGNKKNSNIPLNKILSLRPYSDAVEIEKDSGRSPIIRLSSDADIFAMVLGRVINDLNIS